MGQEYFTVSELNGFIKDVISAGFPQPLWVCGEIQGFDRNRHKNHIFFELIEKDADSKDIVARIGLVIFSGRKNHINDVLKRSENAFELKDDIEVKFLCKIDFYAPHGAVRLIVESIDPVYTLGKLAQQKQKLIALLKKKGTLDKNRQCELSMVPLRVGLITAYDCAAYNDFLSELTKSRLGFCVSFCSALMQGKKAEKDVCRALETLSRIDNLDVIVITRGGGSIAELSCFDSQMIAEKIATLPIPVLSGIGHEINITITDMAAHTHAKTPTAIAQFLVNRIENFLERLDENLSRIVELAQSHIESNKQNLKELAFTIRSETLQYLRAHDEKLIRLRELIAYRPGFLLSDYKKVLGNQKEVFVKALNTRMSNERLKIKNYEKMIDILHPVHTLQRGFSITRTKRGQIIKSVSEVRPQDELITQMCDGTVESEVKTIK